MQRLCQPRAPYMLAVCGSPDSVEMSPVTQCVTPHFKVQHASENLNLDFYNLLESALYRCNRTTHAYRAYESPGGLLPRWLARTRDRYTSRRGSAECRRCLGFPSSRVRESLGGQPTLERSRTIASSNSTSSSSSPGHLQRHKDVRCAKIISTTVT